MKFWPCELFGSHLVSDAALLSCAFFTRCVSISISLVLGHLLVFVTGDALLGRVFCMHDDGAVSACLRLVILVFSINWVMLSMFTSWCLFGDAGVPIVN